MNTTMRSSSKKINSVALLSWFLSSFFVFYQFFLQTIASVMSNAWMKTFHLDMLGVSNLSSSFFYAYVLMQIPVGLIYDRYKTKPVLIFAAAVLTLGCFMMAMSQTFYMAMLARFLMGTGSAFGFIGLLQVTAQWFSPRKFALMLGLSEAFAMTGVTLGIILLAWLIGHYNWQVMMYGAGAVAALLMFAIIFILQDKPKEKTMGKINLANVVKQVVTVLKNKQLIVASVYAFFIFSIITAFTSLWGVSFLTHTSHVSRTLATSMMSAALIGIAIGGPLNGYLSSKVERPKLIMMYGAALATLTMSAVVFLPGLSTMSYYILFFLVGVFCSTYIQALSIINASVDESIRGTALSVANMLIIASAPILQLSIGAMLDTNFFHLAVSMAENYRLSIAILPMGMLVAFITTFYVKEVKN